MALWGLHALWPLLCGTKRAGAEGAPTRKGGKGRRGHDAAGGRGWKWGAPGDRAGGRGVWGGGRCARRGPPHPLPRTRSHRSHFTFNPFPYDYHHLFPRKAGIRGCPSEPRRSRHFPGKARRASAPGAPEREPEGSARPRALLRAGRAPGSGVLAPGAPVPSLRPAPPRSVHCQPGKPAPGPPPSEAPERPCGLPRPRRSPRPPRRSPRWRGASLRLVRPKLCIRRSRPRPPRPASPGAHRWTRIPPPPSLCARDARLLTGRRNFTAS